MAINSSFEMYKLKRLLKRNGNEYEIIRAGTNPFGEPDTSYQETIGVINGLYHEESVDIQVVTGDTTQVRTKKSPMILCTYEDAAYVDLKINDLIVINEKTFKIVGFKNIQEWNLLADISLEVLDDGVHTGL